MTFAGRLRVGAVGHTFSVPLWRGKIREWAKSQAVLAIAPRYWREPLFEVVAEEETNLRTVPVLFPGRNYGYVYHPIAVLLLLRFRPEVLYIEEEPASLACLQFALFARCQGIPFVFVTWENLPLRKRRPSAAAEAFVLRHAAGAVCGSKEVKALLRAKGFEGPVLVAPHCGVPVEFFSRNGHASQAKRLLYCGSLSHEKGVGVLLDAMGLLPLNLELAVYGDGPLRSEVIRRAKEDPRLSWHPPVPPHEIRSLIEDAAAVVLAPVDVPWQQEQFGRIVAEAMAVGRPAVVSDTPALARLVRDPGLIAHQGDPWSLAQKITNALSYQRADQLSRSVRERYAVPVVSEKMLLFLQERAQQRKPAPGKESKARRLH